MYSSRKILIGSILSVILTSMSYAHPLDVSNTSLTIDNSSIEGITYIHPVEIDRILIQSGNINPASLNIDTYYASKDILTKYLSETLSVENQGASCSLGNFEVQEGLMIDEIFSGGFPISYTFHCNKPIYQPNIRVTLFNNIPLQTNKLSIYTNNSGTITRSDYRVLNTKKTSHIFLGNSGITNDSDNDGLGDEDELIYRTNPQSPDTDKDGYTDFVEIQNSWDPLSKELSPGQNQAQAKSTETAIKNQDPKKNTLSQDTTVWGGKLFTETLKKIREYIDSSKNGNLLPLLLIVMILGFVHAMGPGHSKGVLVSQILEKNFSLEKIILYSGVFSIVHLLDIIVVVVISRFFLNILDPSLYLPAISQISIVLILGIGLWLLYRGIIEKKKSHIESPRKKEHIVLAIITGLTPCAFGWSIFLMLIATKSMELALPILASLGFGIFVCLTLVGLTTYIIRSKVYNLAPSIGKNSPIISASFIIFIGSGLLLQQIL